MAGISQGRQVSGRRIVIICGAAGLLLFMTASLTAKQAWRVFRPATTTAAATSVPPLAGQAVWADRTRLPPPLNLPDQNGQVFSLAAQSGKVVVVTFMDTACTTLCPLEGRALASARAQLPASAPVELVVVSTDPAADTPAAARAFAARSGWNGRWQWHWLLARPGQLARVWHAYGVSVSSSLAHTSVLYLIGKDSYERAGLVVPALPQEIVTDLRQLAAA
jgi:cytochrome oxidase Cu insertion factor (SCO1/SenC/PrrC family)